VLRVRSKILVFLAQKNRWVRRDDAYDLGDGLAMFTDPFEFCGNYMVIITFLATMHILTNQLMLAPVLNSVQKLWAHMLHGQFHHFLTQAYVPETYYLHEFDQEEVPPKTTCYYIVTAVDEAGNEGDCLFIDYQNDTDSVGLYPPSLLP